MNKYIKVLIVIFAVFALILQIISIYTSNKEALNSVSATKIQKAIDTLKEENVEIESQMLTLASYNTIASRAGELGYSDNKEFVSLYDPVHVAIVR